MVRGTTDPKQEEGPEFKPQHQQERQNALTEKSLLSRKPPIPAAICMDTWAYSTKGKEKKIMKEELGGITHFNKHPSPTITMNWELPHTVCQTGDSKNKFWKPKCVPRRKKQLCFCTAWICE